MKKKDLILSVVIGSFLVLLFTILPLTHRFSFSSFGIFGVNAEPAKSYNIRLSLPQANLLSEEVKVVSNKKLMKVFNINENAINPVITLTGDPQSKVWNGIFKFEKTPFLVKNINEVSRNEKGAYTSTLLQGDLINPVSNEKMLANIYVLENGSVIQYVSVTIQKENGDLVSMYTFGKLPPVSTFDDSSSNAMEVAKAYDLVAQTNYQYVLKKTQATYTTLTDPYNTISPKTVITQRADAMAMSPLSTVHSVSLRSWAFFNGVEQFYKDVYTRFGSSPWAQAGIYQIVNSIRTTYLSDISLDTCYPPASSNQTSPISVSISLPYTPFSISYSITLPSSGITISWTKESTIQTGNYNKGTITLRTAGPDYASTFDTNWRSSLNWIGTDSQATSSFTPDSSYKGCYVKMNFYPFASLPFYANFYSGYYYSIRAGNGALWDLYYVQSNITMTNTRLDQ